MELRPSASEQAPGASAEGVLRQLKRKLQPSKLSSLNTLTIARTLLSRCIVTLAFLELIKKEPHEQGKKGGVVGLVYGAA